MLMPSTLSHLSPDTKRQYKCLYEIYTYIYQNDPNTIVSKVELVHNMAV